MPRDPTISTVPLDWQSAVAASSLLVAAECLTVSLTVTGSQSDRFTAQCETEWEGGGSTRVRLQYLQRAEGYTAHVGCESVAVLRRVLCHGGEDRHSMWMLGFHILQFLPFWRTLHSARLTTCAVSLPHSSTVRAFLPPQCPPHPLRSTHLSWSFAALSAAPTAPAARCRLRLWLLIGPPDGSPITCGLRLVCPSQVQQLLNWWVSGCAVRPVPSPRDAEARTEVCANPNLNPNPLVCALH